jgi:RND family efflux transporter MFP subunit
MLKKNIIAIVMLFLLIGAFTAGYFVGKGARQAPVRPPTRTAQQEQKVQAQPPAEQTDSTASSGQQAPDETPLPESAEQTPTPQTAAVPTVTPVPVGQVFYGTAVPYDETNIQSKQGGTITMLKAEEGDMVSKGQVLVRFDDSDVQLELERAKSSKNSTLQQVQQAESNFKTVQTNFERTQKLFDEQLVSKQELDNVANQLEVARASLNSARETVTQADTQISIIQNSLKDFQVTAPISGVVDKKNYNLGEVYQGGSVIYHLIQINRIYVEVEVPETYIQKIKEKMNVKVVFDALEDQTFSGVVDRILPSSAEDNRNFTAKVLVQNPELTIKPGMFARVEVVLEED